MNSLISSVLLSVLVLTFGSLAHADWVDRETTISYGNFRSYYSCDYAESQTTAYLKTLGARSVKVRCSGGLPDFDSVFIRASFQVQTLDQAASWQTITLRSSESCDFNETILKHLLPLFETRGVHSSSSCWYSEGSLDYRVDVVK